MVICEIDSFIAYVANDAAVESCSNQLLACCWLSDVRMTVIEGTIPLVIVINPVIIEQRVVKAYVMLRDLAITVAIVICFGV